MLHKFVIKSVLSSLKAIKASIGTEMRRTKIPTENVDTTYDTGQGVYNGAISGEVHIPHGGFPPTGIGISAQSSKLKGLGTQVHPPHVCTHELSKTSYNDRDDLSEILDDDGILKLMKYTLNDEDYVQVWRSCHGGTDPALGLVFHLARTERTTLEEFWAVCSSCGFNDVSEIIQSECMRSPSVASQQLDKQELSLLTKIAEKISENPNSRRKGPPWKTIASSMGLSIHTIEKLDAPSAQSRNSESLTMTFISFMTGKFPFTKVAAIAQGLVAIGRNDVLQEKMFEKCRKEGCISIQ